MEEELKIRTTGVVMALFKDRYATYFDYLDAVEAVHGAQWRNDCEVAFTDEIARSSALGGSPNVATPEADLALLLRMPEADFRFAVELAATEYRFVVVDRISAVLATRGAPWRFDADGFAWVGDEAIEELALQPAISALADSRFSGGVRSEFTAARDELRNGTPTAYKQALSEAASAVESAMKVVLSQNSVPFAQNDTAQKLFEALVAAEIVPRHMERVVLGAATPRNKSGGHGAGEVAHDVPRVVAEAVVGATAVAIAYLQTLLP